MSGNTIKITSNSADNDLLLSLDTCDSHSNRKTATLGIVASSTSVVQCEELQIGPGSIKNTYSKFAMLVVETQHENLSHPFWLFISPLGNVKSQVNYIYHTQGI